MPRGSQLRGLTSSPPGALPDNVSPADGLSLSPGPPGLHAAPVTSPADPGLGSQVCAVSLSGSHRQHRVQAVS